MESLVSGRLLQPLVYLFMIEWLHLGENAMVAIIVADDDPNVRETVSVMLAAVSGDVRTASDGSELLNLVRERQPDVVIVDLLMPNCEGIETIMRLRDSHPRIGIIATTGGGMRGDFRFLDVAERAGAHYRLPKPFKSYDIYNAVEAAREASCRSEVEV